MLVGPLTIKNALFGVILIYVFRLMVSLSCLNCMSTLAIKTNFDVVIMHCLVFFQEKTKARWFVDSSKKLTRLQSLLSDSSVNVLPIHIVRRPEGVVCSNMAKGRGFYASLHSYYSGLWSRYKFLRRKPHLLVSYEELCSCPEQVMSRIMNKLGLHFEVEQLDWTSHDHHNVNGNKRTRTTRQSSIRLDERWRRDLSIWQRLVVKLLRLNSRLGFDCAMESSLAEEFF